MNDSATQLASSQKSVRPTRSKALWYRDVLAGFQVSLIALPLCLGIAIASGFPPVAGILSAIIGGLMVSRISGTHVTINGPAAGLIVVILAGVERLGHGDAMAGYQLTLAAIVCAGLIQIAFGLLRVGRLSALFPNAAVHGMMTAIGIIVFAKQLPTLLGTHADAPSVFGILSHLGELLAHANPLVAGTGLVGIAVLVILPGLKWRFFKFVPPAVWVVAIGAFVGWLVGFRRLGIYELWGEAYHLGPDLYLNLPSSVFSTLGSPDFSQILSADFAITVISIALVASLETLLSAAAVDKIDPLGRKSNLDRDLLAIGIGTTLSGMLGGLPMIAEIVRSNANIAAGARTGWANFSHGIFLFIIVLLCPWVLSSIPLASLAALLVYTGCRLASPKQLKHMADIGADQAAVFITTVVAVLATDLLVGITIGIGVEILLHLSRRVPPRDLFRCKLELRQPTHDTIEIRVHSCLIFTNIVHVVSVMEKRSDAKCIIVDLSTTPFMDHTALDRLHVIKAEKIAAGVDFQILESGRHRPSSFHHLAARRLEA